MNETRAYSLRTAVSESPLLAYLDSLLADWSCSVCQSTGPCEHDETLDPIFLLLELVYALVAGHRSTSKIMAALGGTLSDPTAHECSYCHEPWPCSTIVKAEKATKTQVDAWIAAQPWGPQLPSYSLTSENAAETRARRDALVEASLSDDGRSLCPNCGEDVSEGIEEWRQAVNAAYEYKVQLDMRIQDSIAWSEEKEWADRQGAEWVSGYRSGLELSRAHTGTQLNILLGSHHPHIGFRIAQREAGHINPNILI